MEKFNASRSTGNDIQSSIFLKSLRQQMDKMASSLRKDELVKTASSYMNDGCSEKEAEELLILDGFDKELVQSYLSKLSATQHDENDIRWGFDLEDSYGKILTHEDLGIEVFAADEKDAMVKAEQMVRQAGSDPDFERVIGVYPIG